MSSYWIQEYETLSLQYLLVSFPVLVIYFSFFLFHFLSLEKMDLDLRVMVGLRLCMNEGFPEIQRDGDFHQLCQHQMFSALKSIQRN